MTNFNQLLRTLTECNRDDEAVNSPQARTIEDFLFQIATLAANGNYALDYSCIFMPCDETLPLLQATFPELFMQARDDVIAVTWWNDA